MTAEREMSLQEYIGTLPDIHRAVREYRELVEALERLIDENNSEPMLRPSIYAWNQAEEALAKARGDQS